MGFFEKLRGGPREKIPTLPELNVRYAGIKVVKLPTILAETQGEAAKPAVVLKTNSISLLNTDCYKGKEQDWKAYLVSDNQSDNQQVEILVNKQAEVKPGEILQFFLPGKSCLKPGKPVKLYYEKGTTAWIFVFDVPQFLRRD